ncbi:elongation factor P [Candidatus Giovannonibacteria bacterium]|nr:elongation factor P [Candidatus Giovannonibacteria bacterium]
MLSYTDLTPGRAFVLDGEPYEVLDYQFVRMQQRKPVVQTKIKNLATGKVVAKTFQPSDTFQEAEIEKEELVFIYARRGEYIFQRPGNPKDRLTLQEDLLGEAAKFLKSNLAVTAHKFNEKIISVKLPIKIDYLVKEAPPGFKGDTATGGTKSATLENGLQIQVPLFIEAGDTVRANTQSGEYTERVKKA